MSRVKSGTISRTRRKKVLKEAKGYFGSKHRLYKTANEQVMKSGQYAYRDRKQKKRDFRKLWITRINAACRQNDISYSKFINGLNIAGITVNRKMLSEVAIDSPESFTNLVIIAKDALKGNVKVPKVEEKKPVKKEEKVVEESVKEEKTVKAVKPKEKTEVKATPVKKAKVEEKALEPKKEVVKKDKVDLASKTVTELKQMAKEKNITGYSTMKKDDLINALK